MDEMHKNKREYVLGVDVGGTKILLLLADKDGQTYFKKKVESSGNLNEVCNIIDDFIEESKIDVSRIEALCMGVPGEINGDGIVRLSIQLDWKDVNVTEYVQSRYRFPVYVKNDVNLSALGERWLGNGENTDHMIYISIGTGIGGAVIANGHLVEGYNHSAGEIGYMLDKSDLSKGLHNEETDFGSLERKISGKSLTDKAKELGLTSEMLFQLYGKHNEDVNKTIDNFILELSVVIANMISILNPEYVIIGGGVSVSMDKIIPIIRDKVSQISIFDTQIKRSKLGGETGAFGCVYYAFYEA